MAGQRMRLLVVDDEPMIRDLLSEVARGLESVDIDVMAAEHGRAALDVALKQQVDVIISDLKMPVMGGLDLLCELRQKGWFHPFIIVTGYDTKESALEALRLGAFDFVKKPFDIDQLSALLTDAIKLASSFNEVITEMKAEGKDVSGSYETVGRLIAMRAASRKRGAA